MTDLRYSETPADQRYITREDVEGCDNVRQLAEWDAELQATADGMRAQVSARLACQTAAAPWTIAISKALAHVEQGRARIKRRLRALGVDPDPTEKRVAALENKLHFAMARAAWGDALEAAIAAGLTEEERDRIKAHATESLAAREAA